VPSPLRSCARLVVYLLIAIATVIPSCEALSGATRHGASSLAFAPTQHVVKHLSRSLVRISSAAAAGAVSEIAGHGLHGEKHLAVQSVMSDGVVATAVAPARDLPDVTVLSSAAAYRGTMALSYDSFIGSLKKCPKMKVRLPVVLAAAAATGLVSALYTRVTRNTKSYEISSRSAVCSYPFAESSRGKLKELTTTMCSEMVNYTAFYGLHHAVLSALPLLAGTWYGCAVSGAGTGLLAAILAEQMTKRSGSVPAKGSVRKGEVAAENFVFVGAMSAMRMALRVQ